MVFAGTHDNRMPLVGAGSRGGRIFAISRGMSANRVLRMAASANWKAGEVRSGSNSETMAPYAAAGRAIFVSIQARMARFNPGLSAMKAANRLPWAI